MTSRPVSGGNVFGPILERRAIAWLAIAALATLTVCALAWVVRPFGSPSIGPDAAAPVIHFQHLVRLQAIEGDLSQTAKPLLTVIYGVSYALAGWHGIVWSSLITAALCVAFGAVLAYRLGGPIAAGFVALAFLFSPVILRDVVVAYAAPWAALALLGAGLAVTSTRPHWATAGVLLAVATLARPEAFAVVGVTCGGLVAADALARIRRSTGPPRRAYLLFLGFAGIPIFLLHDGVLMGDPLFWLMTARENSEVAGTVRSLRGMVEFMIEHIRGYPALIPLAILSVVFLVARSRWGAAIGLTAVTVGIAGFFIVIGAGGTAVPLRYFGVMDLGLIFAAGIGLGALAVPEVRRRLRQAVRWNRTAAALAAFAIGGLLAPALAPNWYINRQNFLNAREQVTLHENQEVAMSIVRAAVDEARQRGSVEDMRVLVPPRLRSQSVVDLGLPLTSVGRISPRLVEESSMQVEPGDILYHDRLDDAEHPAWASVEIDEPTVIGDLRLVPLLSDADRGMWVVRVEASLTQNTCSKRSPARILNATCPRISSSFAAPANTTSRTSPSRSPATGLSSSPACPDPVSRAWHSTRSMPRASAATSRA